MSFILEALKKSEQQRQGQNAPQQKVHKRTLSLQASRSGQRSYWLLAGLLPLLMLGSWWLYSETAPIPGPSPEGSQATRGPVVTSSAKDAEPAVATPAPPAAPQRSIAPAEPAPVPSVYVAAPPIKANAAAAKLHEPAAAPQRVDSSITEVMKTVEPVAVTAGDATAPHAIDRLPMESGAAQMPRYFELSRELRDRMPPLSMSMHFYNNNPDRRLVRINDRLLREGDWVSRDVALVEITPTGVILNFLGKTFELSGSRR